MEQVMCSSDVLHEGRCIKRIADYTNQQHPSYSATKKIKLDEHLVSVDPIQEYWKVSSWQLVTPESKPVHEYICVFAMVTGTQAVS